MDYDDNDCEGQNLHLAGEESSKISSVLRPFALPKFDFDDSLQGHLRFDSLVENEVFLGIPSREHNQWIEDFSRGGSGIEFSSSAAESCALPRHINVWSEATSSESVEMLLKAVGQEEMVRGEKLMEPEPGDQLGSSTKQIENVGQDNQMDDVNSPLPSDEVDGTISSSNQSAGIEVVQTEYALQDAETIVSPYIMYDDSTDGILIAKSENSNIKLKRTSDNRMETCGLVNESLSTGMQEGVPVLKAEIRIDKTESSGQNGAVSVKDSVDQDKISDTSFISAVCLIKAISHSVEERKEGYNENEVRLGESAIETDCTENQCSHEVPSELEPAKEEYSVEDILAGSHSTFEAPHVTLEVVGNPSDKIGTRSHADVPDNTFEGRVDGEKPVIDDTSDAAVRKENVEDGDHAGSVQTSTKCIISMQLDACENDLDVVVCERDVKKLPLDSSEVVSVGNGKEVSNFSGEGVKVDAAIESQPNRSAGAYLALNTEVEDTKLTSSLDELVDINELNLPSCDQAFRDQNKETKPRALKQPITSVSEEYLGSNDLAPVLETDKGTMLDSQTGEILKRSQPVLSVDLSSVAMPNEGNKELCEKMENSSNHLSVQGVGAEAAHIGEPVEAEIGRNLGASSSTVSVTSCTVEMDKLYQVAPPDISCIDLPQSVINNQASLEGDGVENTAEVLTSEISGVNVSSKEEGIFSFDIRPLRDHSTEDSGKGLQSFPIIQACKLSLTGEESLSTSGSSLTDPVVVKEVPHANFLTPLAGGVRGSTERKARRASSKSGKASVNKGNHVNEKTPLRQDEKWEKSSQFLRPLGAGQLVTFESTVKPRRPVSIPTPSLPDLNTSAPSSAFFQQPFTDLQQVQLRAQIFVYGSLIQGSAPDETCMVSAFGMSDGGRSFWEPSWRACVERFHGQKSQGKNTETPASLRSDAGAKALDETIRRGFPQIEAFTSMAGRASKKSIPFPVNPMISLSSPLWDISAPSAEALSPSSTIRSPLIDYQTVSPLTPYQTPPVRNYVSHTTWSSQAPYPVPWLSSSETSPYDIGSTYPAFPIMQEPVKLTPDKESSLAVISSTKHVSPIPITQTGSSTIFAGASSFGLKKLKVSSGQTADTKARKRKKSSSDAEDAVQIFVTTSLADCVSAPVLACQLSDTVPAVEALSHSSFMARNQGDQIPTPVISCHYSTSVAVGNSSGFVQKGSTNQFFSMASASATSDQFKRGDLDMDKRVLNIEDFSNVEEAKLQAQEAAAHAAAAISQCEGVWSQLGQQENSGLPTEAQSKLSSCAVVIAAAASVAKAAAAAAKIALTAALQAKQMADEAVASSTGHDAILVSSSINMVSESPLSILRGGDQPNAPRFAISVAREAARKRVEAASDATRHAENLDAIVKAAELAAEAVSHAGKIVSMGEPFSLSELVESGPNSYWKVLQAGSVPGLKSNDNNKCKSITSNDGEVPEDYINQHEGPDKDMYFTSDGASPIQELSRNVVDEHVAVIENITASGKHWKNFKPQKDKRVSEAANNVVVSHPDIGSRSASYALSSIKEGSHVEVLKDHGDLTKAWFSASVLSLKDGEALVSYTELKSDEGSEQRKEWISVEAKDGEAPKVRIPHQMADVQFEGTRKRRRSAVKDYTWSVGDKVDAWVQDCWREGVIAEKNKKEATTLSIHFEEQGEVLLVKVWHLRPTLIWNDGRWIEWRRPGQDPASQGDTPMEKRPKLGGSSSSSTIEAKGKAKVAKNLNVADIGRNQVPRLPFSATEKVFSIGSTREENKTLIRTMRSGVEKKGSRVVFGVPKPGKKRKFMEVSKHYVSDRVLKTNVSNDSVKLAKFGAPQGSGSLGFKTNNSKLDLKDTPVAESRTGVVKSGKPPSIPSRTLARKDDSTISRSIARNAALSDKEKGSISNDENESGEQSTAEFGSSSNVEETSRGSLVFSSQALPQDNRKKTAVKNIKSGRLNQGKLAPASVKSAKNEACEKSISDCSEPRRSNRRIQPTSRLLEGLQSSLLISKIPSHEKIHRNQRES